MAPRAVVFQCLMTVAVHICWLNTYETSLDRHCLINFLLDSLMTPSKKKTRVVFIVLFLFLWTMTTNVIDSCSLRRWHPVWSRVVIVVHLLEGWTCVVQRWWAADLSGSRSSTCSSTGASELARKFTVGAARVMSECGDEHWQATEGDTCETSTLWNQLTGEEKWHSGGSLSCK